MHKSRQRPGGAPASGARRRLYRRAPGAGRAGAGSSLAGQLHAALEVPGCCLLRDLGLRLLGRRLLLLPLLDEAVEGLDLRGGRHQYWLLK